jgi:hypothetical protein
MKGNSANEECVGQCLTAAEQSVQWIGGILRDLPAFFWLRAFSALRHYPSPLANHYRQPLGRAFYLLNQAFVV